MLTRPHNHDGLIESVHPVTTGNQIVTRCPFQGNTCPDAALAAWPTFHAATGAVQSLAPGKNGIRSIDLAREHGCDFWSQIDH